MSTETRSTCQYFQFQNNNSVTIITILYYSTAGPKVYFINILIKIFNATSNVIV